MPCSLVEKQSGIHINTSCMGEQNVWAVFLGGKIRKGALVEDHELVFVVALDEIAARKQAKLKWAAEEVHVDGTQCLRVIDGYQIRLEESLSGGDDIPVDNRYTA